MLRNRLLVAVILISVAIFVLNQGGLLFFAVVALFVLVSGYEFFQLMRSAGYQPQHVLGFGLIALFLTQAHLKTDWTRTILILAIMITLVRAVFRPSRGWLVGWGLTFVGALYIGGLGAYFLLVRDLPDGKIWAGMLALSVWGMDTAAYFFGKRWGRHGFFVAVSPMKTWEGAIGGWAVAIFAMLVLGSIYGLALVHSIALGVGTALSGTFGDLAESVIKRQLGAKDSSSLLQGHGGVLDRIDSLLFGIVFVYFYVTWILPLAP